MIKTLRITVIITAILAVVFFVLSAVFGLRHDKDKEAFLAKPSATQVLKKNAASRSAAEAEGPLIKQAQAFALRINPPAPVQHVAPVHAVKEIETPKFKLLGTSICPQEPNKSMALVDEPGKGMHWVVPSDKIDYLTIEKVEDGKILYTDGKKQMEMLVEKPPPTQAIWVLSGLGAQQPPNDEPNLEQIKSNAEFIRKIMEEANQVKTTGQIGEMGIRPEEANDLEGLGEFLKQIELDQKKAEEAQRAANSEANNVVNSEADGEANSVVNSEADGEANSVVNSEINMEVNSEANAVNVEPNGAQE
jgi:hypothetical protein